MASCREAIANIANWDPSVQLLPNTADFTVQKHKEKIKLMVTLVDHMTGYIGTPTPRLPSPVKQGQNSLPPTDGTITGPADRQERVLYGTSTTEFTSLPSTAVDEPLPSLNASDFLDKLITDFPELSLLDLEAPITVPTDGHQAIEYIGWFNVGPCDLPDDDFTLPPTPMDDAPTVPAEVTQAIADAAEETLD